MSSGNDAVLTETRILLIQILKNADALRLSGAIKESLKLLQEMLAIAKDNPALIFFEGLVSNRIGVLLQHYNESDYETALVLHYRHLEISRLAGDAEGQILAYSNLGLCFYHIREYVYAMTMLEEACRLCSGSGNDCTLSKCLSYMSLTLLSLNGYDRALSLIDDAIQVNKRLLGSRCLLAMNYGQRGWLYENYLDNYNLSLENYEISLKIFKEGIDSDRPSTDVILQQPSSSIGYLYRGIAKCLRKLGRFEESIVASLACIQSLQSISDRPAGNEDSYKITTQYSDLSCCHLLLGQWSKAVYYANVTLDRFRQYRAQQMGAASLTAENAAHQAGKSDSLSYNRKQYILDLFEDEKRVYGYLTLAQVRLGLALEALLTSEQCRQRGYLNIMWLGSQLRDAASTRHLADETKKPLLDNQVVNAEIEMFTQVHSPLYGSTARVRRGSGPSVGVDAEDGSSMNDGSLGCLPLEVDLSLYNIIRLEGALQDLKCATLYFFVIQCATIDPQLITWFIHAADESKVNRPVHITCKSTALRDYGISDLREYVSNCRRAMGFSGWKYVGSNFPLALETVEVQANLAANQGGAKGGQPVSSSTIPYTPSSMSPRETPVVDLMSPAAQHTVDDSTNQRTVPWLGLISPQHLVILAMTICILFPLLLFLAWLALATSVVVFTALALVYVLPLSIKPTVDGTHAHTRVASRVGFPGIPSWTGMDNFRFARSGSKQKVHKGIMPVTTTEMCSHTRLADAPLRSKKLMAIRRLATPFGFLIIPVLFAPVILVTMITWSIAIIPPVAGIMLLIIFALMMIPLPPVLEKWNHRTVSDHAPGKGKSTIRKDVEGASIDFSCSDAFVASRSLYALFIQSFDMELLQLIEKNDLLIVTHDVMNLVPFAALSNVDGIYMVSNFKIHQSPSIIFSWEQLQKVSNKRGKAVDAPGARLWQNVFVAGKRLFSELNTLEQSTKEVELVISLLDKRGIAHKSFCERGPTISEMCNALQTCSVVHIATHANSKGALVLRGNHDDELHAIHIYEACAAMGPGKDLRADLVVLNACVLITDNYLIDSVDGIVRALLSCGVSCVLSTICDVEDSGAKLLIQKFYEAMLGTPGRPVDSVEALQSAVLFRLEELQKHMSGAPGTVKRAGPYKAQDTGPHDWAGYVITGIPVDALGPKPFDC